VIVIHTDQPLVAADLILSPSEPRDLLASASPSNPAR
jgi:hypothetical protein